MKQSEMEKKKAEKLKRMREKQVQNKIQETIHYDPESMKKTISRKTRELRLRFKLFFELNKTCFCYGFVCVCFF